MKKQTNRRMSGKYGWKRTALGVLQAQSKSYRYFFAGSRVNLGFKSGVQKHGFDDNDLGQDVWLGLKMYVRILLDRKVKLHTLLVLGSRAKGRAKPSSDIDVLVIASGLPGRSSAELTNLAQKISNIRRSILLADNSIFLGIQPSGCCSREEFLQWLGEFKILAWDAICYGIQVYDDGFWAHALRRSKEIRYRYGLEDTELRHVLRML